MNERDILRLLPAQLLCLATKESKTSINEINKLSTNTELKTKAKLADIFNRQIAPHSKNKLNIYDIDLDGELNNDSYKLLLSVFGISNTEADNKILWAHAKLVDDILSEEFRPAQIKALYSFFEKHFECNELNLNFAETTKNEFYNDLLFGFIFHLDAYIHNQLYSQQIEPVSLAWLFMQTPNLQKNNTHTVPSRSFIQFLEVVLYYQKNNEMPKNTHGLGKKVNWHTDDSDGKVVDFIKRKKEGKRISLDEFIWLSGFNKCEKSDDNLREWQDSFIQYMKDENIQNVKVPWEPQTGAVIWLVYAFFQAIYENNLKNKSITYYDYHELWQFMSKYYDNRLDVKDRDKRIKWTQDIIELSKPFHKNNKTPQ